MTGLSFLFNSCIYRRGTEATVSACPSLLQAEKGAASGK